MTQRLQEGEIGSDLSRFVTAFLGKDLGIKTKLDVVQRNSYMLFIQNANTIVVTGDFLHLRSITKHNAKFCKLFYRPVDVFIFSVVIMCL